MVWGEAGALAKAMATAQWSALGQPDHRCAYYSMVPEIRFPFTQVILSPTRDGCPHTFNSKHRMATVLQDIDRRPSWKDAETGPVPLRGREHSYAAIAK